MLKAFLAYYGPHKRLFFLDFGCAVVSGLLELGFPIAVRAFVDDLLPRHDWLLILLAAAGLAAVYVLNAGLTAVVTYWGHMLGIDIETEMRARAFDHLQKLSFSFYDKQKTGHLIARVTKDLEEIGEVAHHGPEDLFIAVMTIVGALALMLMVHRPLALMTAAILPVVGFVTLRYGGRMTRNWQAQYGRVGAFNARIEQNVAGVRVVRAFANESHERRLFAAENDLYRLTKLEAYRIMAAGLSINYLGMRLVQLVVLLGGAAYVVRGDLSPGGFVGFLLLVGVFYRPLEKIAAVVDTYPRGIAGFRRFMSLLATEPDIRDRPGAVEAPSLVGAIHFEAVRFAYTRARVVFTGLDLAVAAGETVAFVGPSGAGKTTLCSLLPRLYEVSGGRVTIDGIDVRDMTLASLRRRIGIVQQEVFLFAGTLRENIAYGRLEATDVEIARAARGAQLDAFVATLPDGLDTVIGERGVMLSGGQRQRVAIARVFLKDPPILILDEATSALDSHTEQDIQRALRDLCAGRTTLIIAHRLATVRHADRIVVIDDGGILEQGRHDKLVSADGAYARLWRAQVVHLQDREEDAEPSGSGASAARAVS